MPHQKPHSFVDSRKTAFIENDDRSQDLIQWIHSTFLHEKATTNSTMACFSPTNTIIEGKKPSSTSDHNPLLQSLHIHKRISTLYNMTSPDAPPTSATSPPPLNTKPPPNQATLLPHSFPLPTLSLIPFPLLPLLSPPHSLPLLPLLSLPHPSLPPPTTPRIIPALTSHRITTQRLPQHHRHHGRRHERRLRVV